MCLNIFLFHTLAIPLSNGMFLRLQEGVEAHDAQADRALAHGGVGGALHRRPARVDEVLQHVVEEAHHVLDEGRMLVPLEIGLEVERATGSTPRCAACRDGRRRSAA